MKLLILTILLFNFSFSYSFECKSSIKELTTFLEDSRLKLLALKEKDRLDLFLKQEQDAFLLKYIHSDLIPNKIFAKKTFVNCSQNLTMSLEIKDMKPEISKKLFKTWESCVVDDPYIEKDTPIVMTIKNCYSKF